MRLIDLLNKIDRGEEVPQKVKFNGNIFIYDKESKEYIYQIDEWCSETLLYEIMINHKISEVLETEIEEVSETEEIEEIEELEELNEYERTGYYTTGDVEFNRKAINELIRTVNKLIRRSK